MDVKITVDLFHVSFGIIGQLGKDLIWHWSQQNHSDPPIWTSERGLPLQLVWGLQDGAMIKTSASMDVEVAEDLFHVSFGIIRQLGKDLIWHWSQQNHSDPPIWTPQRGLPLQLVWGLQDGAMINQCFHGCGGC